MPLRQLLPRWHPKTTQSSSQRKRISSGQVAVVLAVMSLIASIFFFLKSHQVSDQSYDVSVQAQRLSIWIDCHDRDDLKSMPICQEYLSDPPDTFLEEPDLAKTVEHDKEGHQANEGNEHPMVSLKQRFHNEADRLLLSESELNRRTLYPTVIMLRMMGDLSALERINKPRAESIKIWTSSFLSRNNNAVFKQIYADVMRDAGF